MPFNIYQPDDLGNKEMQELIAQMLLGDPRCPVPIGARIEKTNEEPGDTVSNGHRGYVKGSTYVEAANMPLYLVQWDGINVPSKIDGAEISVPYIAVAGSRIKQVTN